MQLLETIRNGWKVVDLRKKIFYTVLTVSYTHLDVYKRQAVEGVGVDSAEVADSGKGHREKTVDKLIHFFAAKGDLCADVHALTELEVSDRFFSLADHGTLAGDLRNCLLYTSCICCIRGKNI